MFKQYIKEIVWDAIAKNEGRKPVGEFYDKYYSPYGAFCGYVWQTFREVDIKDRCDKKIKINNTWVDEKNVVFYKDIYKTQKEAIEKRVDKENK